MTMPSLSGLRLTFAAALWVALAGCATARPPAKPPRSHAEARSDDHYQRGLEALQRRDDAAAERELTACVEVAPDRPDCLWQLGWALWRQEKWDQVVTTWERLQALDPAQAGLEEKLAQARQLAASQQAAQAASLPPVRVLRIRAVGDVMLGTDFPEGHLPPDDGATLLQAVRDLLADADLTFVNLEGPLCDGGETTKCRRGGNCYAFRTPTRYARYLQEAGVDLASTANNHSGDFGEECRRQTEATLDAIGVAWSGPPGSIASVEKNGLRVALIAFHTSPSCNWLNDIPAAQRLVSEAAATHPVVIVSFHGGAEGARAIHVPHGAETFYGENRGDLRAFTRAVIDAGADLVLGHGPHVLRGMEVYRERLIAYSLGNFATYGRFNLHGDLGIGAVLEAVLDAEGRFLGGRLFATRQIGKGIPEPDPENRALALVRRLSREDFPESHVEVSEEGALSTRPAEPARAEAAPPLSSSEPATGP